MLKRIQTSCVICGCFKAICDHQKVPLAFWKKKKGVRNSTMIIMSIILTLSYINLQLTFYLTMLIWKSSSLRVFHDPDRKSRHQANALPLFSRSTSSVLPSRKDSASESSSQLASHRGLGVLNFLSITTSVLPTRLFSAGGSLSSVVTAGMVLKRASWSAETKFSLPRLLLVTFRLDCILSFWAKSNGPPLWNVREKRQTGLADLYSGPVELLNRNSLS